MYRFFALAFVFAAAACGGGDAASTDPTATSVSATQSPTQQVAGSRTDASATPTAAATPAGTYTVADGDTLWDIAVKFDTTVEALVAANGFANADELVVGQVITIAAAPAATATPAQ